MQTDTQDRLNRIKAELERQDREWRRARSALAELGDATVIVPQGFFDGLDSRPPFTAHPRSGVRA